MMRSWLIYGMFFSLLVPVSAAFGHNVSLSSVEQEAISSAPELSALSHNERGLRAASVAVGQLPDPQVQAGIMNVPTDTFSLTQENMTQIKVGLSQSFPEGRSRSIKSKQKKLLADAEHYRAIDMKADILRTVRREWLSLYYWIQSAKLVEDNRAVFSYLVKVTESTLAAGKASQHDVLRAQLELSHIENRLLSINEQIELSRARLGRWVGSDLANKVEPVVLPAYPLPPVMATLIERVRQHPSLQIETTRVAADTQGVELAKQQYLPAWSLGLNYSYRQGDNPMSGDRRADFIGATVNMALPIFPAKRQHKQVAESLETLNVTKEGVHSKIRQMVSGVEQQWAIWKRSTAQGKLYQKRLIPEAKQYSAATLTAYQNGQSDFPTVARAQVAELNARLEGLKIDVELVQARVELLYYEGGDV